MYDLWIEEGWHEANVPAEILDELKIPYEVMPDSSAYVPDAQVFAPFWVFGVWYNAGMPSTPGSRWTAVKSLLTVTRDSPDEQKMVAAELILEGSIPASAKRAALNLTEILSGKRKKVESGVEHT